MADNYNTATALDWDSDIQFEGKRSYILPEGDYDFTVTNVTRTNFPGSKKMPACKQAILTLKVSTTEGPVEITENMFLLSTLEWKLSQFFRCIGMKKANERFRMDWDGAKGRTGRAHIRPDKYEDSTGKERETNNITEFYAPKIASDEEDLPF